MKQQAPKQKNEKPKICHFLKACFLDQSKKRKLCTPLWKLVSKKSSETPIFVELNDVDHLLTLQCGPLIDPKTPKCEPLIDPSAHIYIYIYI